MEKPSSINLFLTTVTLKVTLKVLLLVVLVCTIADVIDGSRVRLLNLVHLASSGEAD